MGLDKFLINSVKCFNQLLDLPKKKTS